MPLTRTATDPLLSDDEMVRRAALLHFSSVPSPDAAKAIVRALLHFLEHRPEVAREFVEPLHTPPLARAAEEPVLELLDHADELVREQGAYILYRIRIRESSRARVLQALQSDGSPWVRAYAAKALAAIGGPRLFDVLAEAIDAEATLEAISRMGEALALLGDARGAEVLRDQAGQLREREAPPDAVEPDDWQRTASGLALFFDALAARLGGEASAPGAGPGTFVYQAEPGRVEIAGGPEHGGFAAACEPAGAGRIVLPQDSRPALALLGHT